MRFAFIVILGWACVSALAAEPVDYLRDIKPILAKSCYACHGPDKEKSGLRLDTAAAIRSGGNHGPAIVPGKSADSLLIRAVTGAEGAPKMPSKGEKLPPDQIALLRAWIDQGAAAPANETAEGPTGAKSKHWAFQPPVRSPLPSVKNEQWCRTAVDRFILARLEKEGIAPAPEADRVTLIRRVSLDLIGLPPTPREVDDFVNDTRPDAFERVVDRLLASPHYGERWGRHWLDLARYADSNGFNIDAPRSIWKYRDWVIDALNRDLPFDQFTIEQLAGDLVPNATLDQKVATGFHRNTLINQEGGIDLEQFRVESVVDRVNTTATVFLGLTVGCAQCHDHKFDPISQRDYYQLFAFFNSSDEPILELPEPGQVEERDRIRKQIAAVEKQLKAVDPDFAQRVERWEKGLTNELRGTFPSDVQAILAAPRDTRDTKQRETLATFYRRGELAQAVVTGASAPHVLAAYLRADRSRAALEKEIAQVKKREPQIVSTMVVEERKTPRPTHIQLGGDFLRKGAHVRPGVPAVLPPMHTPDSPTRLQLAEWVVDPRNPLTARVTVNRIWQQYLGVGLVETENDFGTQGQKPSHPELLDWLACEFASPSPDPGCEDATRGWSLKAVHRLIVTSAVYRQSSRSRPELARVDPRNRLLARQSRIRLEAEVVRDSALVAGGLFNPEIGGPSVFPPQPDGVFRLTQIQREWKAAVGPDRYRRGMYTHFWRSAPHPALMAFDAPESTTSCTRRNRSNTPLQALTLLNDEAFFEFAQGLAARVQRDAARGDEARLVHMFQLSLGRSPSESELKRLVRLLHEARGNGTDPPQETGRRDTAAWTTVARVLLNLDEFITRE